jgi:hypothetical protein
VGVVDGEGIEAPDDVVGQVDRGVARLGPGRRSGAPVIEGDDPEVVRQAWDLPRGRNTVWSTAVPGMSTTGWPSPSSA